jgi:hypothetical protein
VWSVGVVLDPEVLGQHLGFEERLEASTLSSSSRSLPLKDSMNGFSHGLPGSM